MINTADSGGIVTAATFSPMPLMTHAVDRKQTGTSAPVARPVFKWNHDELMREAGESLARRLGTDLALPDAPSRPHRLAGVARWAVPVAALVALALVRWRRRTAPR